MTSFKKKKHSNVVQRAGLERSLYKPQAGFPASSGVLLDEVSEAQQRIVAPEPRCRAAAALSRLLFSGNELSQADKGGGVERESTGNANIWSM